MVPTPELITASFGITHDPLSEGKGHAQILKYRTVLLIMLSQTDIIIFFSFAADCEVLNILHCAPPPLPPPTQPKPRDQEYLLEKFVYFLSRPLNV